MLKELTPQKALKLAIKTEKMGAEFYDRMAKRFAHNMEMADVFTHLSKDEKFIRLSLKKL